MKKCLSFLAGFAFLLNGALASATTEQVKNYKAAFDGEKPKCLTCHVDKLPKKDDGMHELNDYGKKAVALKAMPDDATYKEIGKAPEPAEA